jgi:NAD(P)-dependent dehydrogenase (short-subunit alcohol dehydrogenase family)
MNSWRLRMHEVETPELLEVQLVNAIAPYILNARLKPLLVRTPGAHKHIVNVSAMEGQFYRATKTDKHPHTNMAKAALNMLTRTSAPDFVKDGIHMNAVDTGWVTDEDPGRARGTQGRARLRASARHHRRRGAHRGPDIRRSADRRTSVGSVPQGLQARALVILSARRAAA